MLTAKNSQKSMAETRDIVIIGGGHNGLVTAFYLARAGFKPLVVERREQVGGAAITTELHPGFRVSQLAHDAGAIRPEIAHDMELARYGLKLIQPEPAVTSLSSDGRALTLFHDQAKSIGEIASFSQHDATKYEEFAHSLRKIAAVIADVLAMTPPDIDNPSKADLWGMLQTGRAMRKLGKTDMYRLLRWGPMAVADLVAEYFEDELLRATIAARGIFGTFLGPWSAGSSLVLLLRAAGDPDPAGSTVFAQGGTGALTQAMAQAARAAGADIRLGTEVREIRVKEGVSTGVVLADGEEIGARAVISNADPKCTLLRLLDPAHLSPDFVKRLVNYRMHGTLAKVNLALSGLPLFKGVDADAMKGRIQISPTIDYIEQAFDHSKYGEISRHPYLEITIPSLTDSSLAPSGQHVMSVYMQYAPYKLKNSDWDSQSDALLQVVTDTLEEYAPHIRDQIVAAEVITPKALEDRYGLTAGHIFHGELALDQFFTMRPLLDWPRYATPIAQLFLCGSGTHPGVGLTGGSGANAAREILKHLKASRNA